MNSSIKNKWSDKVKNNLEELTINISGMFKSLQIIKDPIRESTESVPKATIQLAKITEQTEAATHRILDQLETVTDRNTDALDILASLREKVTSDNIDKELGDLIEKLESVLSGNIEDSYMIMESLQFQDITSQQVDYIKSLLELIEVKLSNLLSVLGQAGIKMKTTSSRYFDPNAEFGDAADKQAFVDKLLGKKEK